MVDSSQVNDRVGRRTGLHHILEVWTAGTQDKSVCLDLCFIIANQRYVTVLVSTVVRVLKHGPEVIREGEPAQI